MELIFSGMREHPGNSHSPITPSHQINVLQAFHLDVGNDIFDVSRYGGIRAHMTAAPRDRSAPAFLCDDPRLPAMDIIFNKIDLPIVIHDEIIAECDEADAEALLAEVPDPG